MMYILYFLCVNENHAVCSNAHRHALESGLNANVEFLGLRTKNDFEIHSLFFTSKVSSDGRLRSAISSIMNYSPDIISKVIS